MLSRQLARICIRPSMGVLCKQNPHQCLLPRSIAASATSTPPDSPPRAEDPQPAAAGSQSDHSPEDTAAVVEELTAQIAKAQTDVKKLTDDKVNLTDRLKRALAENDNTIKRYERQLTDAKQYAVQKFAKDLLEPVDVLQKALASVDADAKNDIQHALDSLNTGVKLTHANLLKVFKAHGLVQIDPLGEMFDPNIHEAVCQIPANDKATKPGQIADVLKIGYSLHGRPIRPAQVAVVRS